MATATPGPSPTPGASTFDSTASTFGGFGSAFAAPGLFAAGGGGTIAVADNAGYIDSAIIRSRFRMRYDDAFNLNSPDRAEYFYAKCGCFGNPMNLGVPGFAKLYDQRALGPLRNQMSATHPGLNYSGETRINYQVAATLLRIRGESVDVDVHRDAGAVRQFPVTDRPRPQPGQSLQYLWMVGHESGLQTPSSPNPIGSTRSSSGSMFRPARLKGLGTEHPSLEPGFLIFQRLSDRLYFSGELLDWIPVNATNFAGNVLTYGAGLAYNIALTDHARVAPVVEFVGWTVFNGYQLEPNGKFNPSNPASFVTGNVPEKVVSAGGDTIVNGKFGLRFGLGNYNQPGGGMP